MKRRREYLRFLDKAILALEEAVGSFNRVNAPYKNETTLILLTNAWELLAKSVLKKRKLPIEKGDRGETISAEVAVSRLRQQKILVVTQEDCIQQIISLRHASVHYFLPDVPKEVMHHLLFFGCKFFRDTVYKVFPTHKKDLKDDFLSLSFSDLTTYADKVQKIVSRIKRNEGDKQLAWLLERGIKFDGGKYITQTEFEQQYYKKKRILPHLGISEFIKNTEMVRIVPVQAPRNFTADILLRKGKKNDPSLPVLVKKTDMETDYPFLTHEIGAKLDRNQNFAATLIATLGMKGDPQYHQRVRASKSSHVERYSQAALHRLKKFMDENPDFNPYAARRKKIGRMGSNKSKDSN